MAAGCRGNRAVRDIATETTGDARAAGSPSDGMMDI